MSVDFVEKDPFVESDTLDGVIRSLLGVVLALVGVAIFGYGIVLLIAVPKVCDTDCPGPLELSVLIVIGIAIAGGGLIFGFGHRSRP